MQLEGFQEVRTLRDLEHRERVTVGRSALAPVGAPGAQAPS